MLPLFSLAEAQALDHRLISSFQLSEATLIDGAAKGAYLATLPELTGKRVTFLVGKGNNGSDALEMARLTLAVASSVSVLLYSENGNAENMRRRALLPKECFVENLPPSDTIVDGLFGFGFHGALEGRALELVTAVNQSGSYVIALDVPSAFSVHADKTVCFMARKTKLYDPRKREGSGEIVFVNPGFPEEEIGKNNGTAFLVDESDYDAPKMKRTDYKNSRGHLLVMGGSARFTGAPILSSLASFHAGVGLVSLLSVPSVLEKAYGAYPSIMPVKKEELDLQRFSTVLVGPGWDEGDKELLEKVAESGKPVVIDADGIKHLPGLYFSGKAVITPHLGEFRRLTALLGITEEDSETAVSLVAKRLGTVVVLKGSSLFIGDGNVLYVYDGENPSLGVAGSGDVLSGIISAFLAYGESPLAAALNGVVLHQKVGRILSEKLGFYPAEELIEEIGRNR